MGKADGERFKDKIEVSLDGRQIFYLFFGGAVIASLVFVLGVMVGRRVESRAHATASIASPTHDPLAALDQLDVRPSPEMAFPAALRAGQPSPLGIVDAAIASIEAADANGAGSPEADATAKAAPARLAAETEVAAKAESKVEAKAETKVDKVKVAPQPQRADPGDGSDDDSDDDGGESGAKPKADKSSKSDGDKRATHFTLQLSSFQDRAEADAFFQEMKNAGYAPYIAEAEVADRGTWYRVRLGRYTTYGDAVAAKAEFEKAQRIIAYVTRVRR
jgi:cell division septation protein DedD